MGLGLGFSAGRGDDFTRLTSAIPETLVDLDSAIAASYPGSGTLWTDLANVSGNMILASGANAPTFTADKTFQTDGGDRIQASANPDAFSRLHKTTAGNKYTIALCYREPSVLDSGWLLSTLQFSGFSKGVVIEGSAATTRRFRQFGNTGNRTHVLPYTPVADTYYCLVIAYDQATNKLRFWINEIENTQVDANFNATTSVEDGDLTLFSATDGLQPAPNGMEIYALSVFDKYFDDADVDDLLGVYNDRHAALVPAGYEAANIEMLAATGARLLINETDSLLWRSKA